MIKKLKLACLAAALILEVSPFISNSTYVYTNQVPGVTTTENIISDSEISEVEYLTFSCSSYLTIEEKQGADVRDISEEKNKILPKIAN
ncbi:hypothetical protein SAMN04488700_0871 [Carnobacterium iners]|uniref:Uncharacterized protein n=1 Tax=Carnobacterium iners TaxID=1073423 RepID=A0A1X7MV71_9LACT|nr:hypothetical protein [Carnobacterium iners]SEK56329.1 hypothetical protein SAMN04488114_10635 [Carnobacterium iners]SMH28219.1 hypothetical protein SAMN04488700_0871 [Carnobacterium iners]